MAEQLTWNQEINKVFREAFLAEGSRTFHGIHIGPTLQDAPVASSRTQLTIAHDVNVSPEACPYWADIAALMGRNLATYLRLEMFISTDPFRGLLATAQDHQKGCNLTSSAITPALVGDAPNIPLWTPPTWVQELDHPATSRDISKAIRTLRAQRYPDDYEVEVKNVHVITSPATFHRVMYGEQVDFDFFAQLMTPFSEGPVLDPGPEGWPDDDVLVIDVSSWYVGIGFKSGVTVSWDTPTGNAPERVNEDGLTPEQVMAFYMAGILPEPAPPISQMRSRVTAQLVPIPGRMLLLRGTQKAEDSDGD